jgi:hypothetical protein
MNSGKGDSLPRRSPQYSIDEVLTLFKPISAAPSPDSARFDNVFVESSQPPECGHRHPPQSEINPVIHVDGVKSQGQRSGQSSGSRRSSNSRSAPSRSKRSSLDAKSTDGEEDLGQVWYYKDPMDQIVGPYSSRRMKEWFDKRYFDATLLIQSGASDGPFLPVSAFFPELANAFNEDSPPRSGFQGEKSREKKLTTFVSLSMDDNEGFVLSWEATEQKPPPGHSGSNM